MGRIRRWRDLSEREKRMMIRVESALFLSVFAVAWMREPFHTIGWLGVIAVFSYIGWLWYSQRPRTKQMEG